MSEPAGGRWDDVFDVVVVGSGAAGLAAAITAASQGLSVVVVEKTNVVGGSSAISGGWIWAPGNEIGAQHGFADSRGRALRYLEAELGDALDDRLIDAYLDNAPAMIASLTSLGLEFELGAAFPDYRPQTEGSSRGGRAIRAAAVHGERLGSHIAKLKPPKRELTFMGLGIGSGSDIRHFSRALRSMESFAFVARRMLAHGWQMLRHGRSMRLVNGNALVARLLKIAIDQGVSVLLESRARGLVLRNNRIVGVDVERGTQALRLRAGRGVVLATGGFSHNAKRMSERFEHIRRGSRHFSIASEGATGDGMDMGVAVGGYVGKTGPLPAILAPVSLVQLHGAPATFPHFVDRGKPGIVAVLPNGRRFVNESNSYNDFVTGMIESSPDPGNIRAYLIADARAVARYGLGFAKPFPMPLAPLVRTGYLKRGSTLAELASACGIDAVALESTVAAYNRDAEAGRDTAFGKGGNVYNLFQGDPDAKPNGCLAPLQRAPFYAVEIFPGDLGTNGGLQTDGQARVLNESGKPIAGLFAAGSDMRGPFGGRVPAGGISLGAALVFGFVAGRALGDRPVLASE